MPESVNVMCLNVNGSLCDNLGNVDFVEKMCTYDIVLLSETWTDDFSNINVTGFCAPYSKHRLKKQAAKRNSGGLVCYFKKEIIGGISVIPWGFEDGFYFNFNKDFFGWEEDLFFIFAYMKPSTSSRETINIDVD